MTYREIFPLLGVPLHTAEVVHLDLSIHNRALQALGLAEYIRQVLSGGAIGIGGYAEHRQLYNESQHFSQTARCMHLGVDIWLPATTPIFAPLAGVVHSFQNNQAEKDYGPTIILEHEWQGETLYTLYGHLTTSSLFPLEEGKAIAAGDKIGEVGAANENGGWEPHLHFQVIRDLEGKRGDFYGVMSQDKLTHYLHICPNPMFLIR